jgi:hypothetical protein
LQFGQSLQQSSEQQAALALLLQQTAFSVLVDDVPAMAAAMRPVATARPPNSLTNMVNSLSCWLSVWP